MKLRISQAASESISVSGIGFGCDFHAMPISDSDTDSDTNAAWEIRSFIGRPPAVSIPPQQTDIECAVSLHRK